MSTPDPRRPNIVFILIDDMGWCDLGCYGSTYHETPVLDRLAAEGARFTDAYAAAPVCSPTRASLLTGKYPARVGVTQYIGGHGVGKLLDVPSHWFLPTHEFSLARALRDGGYQTWHVGKWHLGPRRTWPDQHGFDVNIGGCEWGHPTNGYFNAWCELAHIESEPIAPPWRPRRCDRQDERVAQMRCQGTGSLAVLSGRAHEITHTKRFSPYGCPTLADGPDGEYLTDRLTDEAIRLIENAGERPFFLNFWHYAVHIPIDVPPDLVEKYRRKAADLGLDAVDPFETGEHFPVWHQRHGRVQRRIVQSDPAYAAMVENLDTNVGRLLDALERMGRADNTVVIFTSDNGGLSTAEGSPTCNAPLSEGKGWMQDGGVREPLIVRWPGVLSPGTEISEPVTSPDFYPTLLAAAGLPPRPEQHMDGVDFSPLLRGEPFTRGSIYWHYPHYSNQGGTPAAGMRDSDWKLIYHFETETSALYNIRTDIAEQHDLVVMHPETATRLERTLLEWLRTVGAFIPAPNPNPDAYPDLAG